MDTVSPTGEDALSTEDGLRLHTQHWSPPSAPKATVALVHGYAEHCGRYNHVARAFLERNAAVYAYDQRGYGRSEGRRAYVASFGRYLDDLARFLDYVRSQQPDAPLFLFGHSMGGLVVLKYVLERHPSVQGLMLSAPAIEINPDLAPLLRRLAHWIGRLFPTLPTTRSPEGAISRDPEVVEEAENDPLNYHGRVLARTGAEMLRAGEEVRNQLDKLTAPFLVLHGTADTLASPEWSRRLYERAASPDKTIKLYDGLYHETFNEPEQDEVLGDLGDWLKKRVP
ncbi:MAG TPA: lysophospholipase [Salinibacter sp.]|nr:lysophospholipase [Salinibacter sp.]